MAENAPMEVDTPATKQPRFQVKKVRLQAPLSHQLTRHTPTDTILPPIATVERGLSLVLGHCRRQRMSLHYIFDRGHHIHVIFSSLYDCSALFAETTSWIFVSSSLTLPCLFDLL